MKSDALGEGSGGNCLEPSAPGSSKIKAFILYISACFATLMVY